MSRPPFDKFHQVLVVAQRDRDLLPLKKLDEPYWNTWEMLTMFREVNAYREANGRILCDWTDIVNVEQQASGHSDYTKKFALYCAELAVRDD